ncbi:uncharacterized protein C19orf84-like [Neopsephotus bourkii]|uniref:uncharacterized protein C19orf84-like n=1 Tax=Neopsephotus bourkii TaxID=309878 RepID=UPI002AA53E17|nr:uncharacterized protein C19orf84-like [Neopsephotus bourkii]
MMSPVGKETSSLEALGERAFLDLLLAAGHPGVGAGGRVQLLLRNIHPDDLVWTTATGALPTFTSQVGCAAHSERVGFHPSGGAAQAAPFSLKFPRPQSGRGPGFARDCGRARSLPARHLPTHSRHLPSRRVSPSSLREGCAGAARAEPPPSCRPAPPRLGTAEGNEETPPPKPPLNSCHLCPFPRLAQERET